MRYPKLFICTAAAVFFLSAYTEAQTTKNAIKTQVALKQDILPLDANIRMGKLPNGFTYYIRKNAEPKDRVQLYLANKVGSILENDDQQGLAHFMEHMGFNGTKKLS